MTAKQKTEKINQIPLKTGPFKSRFVFLALTFLAGILIGWTVDHFSSIEKSSVTAKNTGDSQISGELNSYKFLNPHAAQPTFDCVYHEKLDDFKNKVEYYCRNATSNGLATRISVYFRDLTNESWFGINEYDKYCPASLSKVPLMIAVFQKAQENPSYLSKKLVYKGSFAAKYLSEHPEIDDERSSLVLNQSYTVEELVNYMILKSDNEATSLIYNDLGANYLDALEKTLGYAVPAGSNSSTNVLSVKTYSGFFRVLYNSSFLSKEFSEKALNLLSQAEYNKGIRRAIPSDIRVCHKYGERDTMITPTKIQIMQLHHAGIVYYPGKPFFICIMTKGSNKQNMEKVIHDITKIIFDEVDSQIVALQKPALQKDIN